MSTSPRSVAARILARMTCPSFAGDTVRSAGGELWLAGVSMLAPASVAPASVSPASVSPASVSPASVSSLLTGLGMCLFSMGATVRDSMQR